MRKSMRESWSRVIDRMYSVASGNPILRYCLRVALGTPSAELPNLPKGSLRRRSCALLIDLAGMAVAHFLVALSGSFWMAVTPGVSASLSNHLLLVVQAAEMLSASAYLVAGVCLLNGTTPGKRLLGLRVVKENGTPVGRLRAIWREVFLKYLPIRWIGDGLLVLSVVVARSSRHRRALHDRWSHTRVVRDSQPSTD